MTNGLRAIMRTAPLMALFTLVAACTSVAPTQKLDAGMSQQAGATTLLKASIAIPTVEGRGKVPTLARLYSRTLKQAGFADGDIKITPMGETATFAATLRGREDGKPILLLGHMDVVAADPADWERDPFSPVEENGYIYGRGSFDNKFDTAMLVTTLAQLKREGFQPRHDIILVLSGDEETTQDSTRVLAETYRDAAYALNGDGGGGALSADGQAMYYSIQAGEKLYADYQIEFKNPGGHSSKPSPVNAITQLSNALSRIGAYQFEPQRSELTRASMAGMADKVEPEIGKAMAAFSRNPDDAAALSTLRSHPQYVGQVGTTCVATMVEAGHATNALPQRAAANINCRIFPGTAIETVRQELERVVNDPAVRVTVVQAGVESSASELRPDVVDAVTKAIHATYPGLSIIPSMAPYATDSSLFRAAGVPSFGTSGLFIRSEDDFVHGLNERVPVAAIPVALEHWDCVIRSLTQ